MPNIYKKKNPRAPYIKQIILYSFMLILCAIAKMWMLTLVFIGLIAFSAFMLRRNWNKGSYSLADYIHQYDKDFPTEDPKGQKQKEYNDDRQAAYFKRLEEIEEEFDYDYYDEDDDY